jgi:transposase-like protein
MSARDGGPNPKRRRMWSAEEKRRIVAETSEPGASVAVVARRHDMNANLLFTWRRAAGTRVSGTSAAERAVSFVPATITADPIPAAAPARPASCGQMEIALAGGDRVTVGADVDPAALARVIKVLSRR